MAGISYTKCGKVTKIIMNDKPCRLICTMEATHMIEQSSPDTDKSTVGYLCPKHFREVLPDSDLKSTISITPLDNIWPWEPTT